MRPELLMMGNAGTVTDGDSSDEIVSFIKTFAEVRAFHLIFKAYWDGFFSKLIHRI